MKRSSFGRMLWMAAFAFLASGAVSPASAQGQTGDRIIIMVPNLAPQSGADDGFGKDVAKELRKHISDLDRYQAVSDDQLKDARKRYGLEESDLYDCIRSRQLAMQQGWGLVLCGDYAQAGNRQVNVSAKFVGADNGETFEVQSFAASEREPKQAAQQIMQAFSEYTAQLRSTLFCQQYIDSQQWQSALENCEKALATNPNAESALYKKGYILWKMDRDAEALEALDKVLEQDPIDQDALKLAGIVATETDDEARAKEYFDRYMELNPGDVQVRLSLATEISNAGDPAAALDFAKQGLEAAPDNLELITYIGHFAANAASNAEQAGDVDPAQITEYYQTAANSYEKVLEAKGDSTSADILERLVVSLYKLGQMDEAVRLGKQATQIQPEEPRLWSAYSQALQEAGQPGEALAAIEKAEELGLEGAAVIQRKALLQLDQGRASQAIASLQQGVQQGAFSTSEAFNTVFARAYQDRFQKGQLDAAYDLLQAAGALAVEQNDKLTRNFWMGYILFQQAQKVHAPMTAASAKKAKPLFERALELFQAARGYEKIHASADVPKLIENTQRFIEIEDALIKRGR